MTPALAHVPFDRPLVEGRFVRRWARFLMEARLADGSLVTAHVPNSGSMMSLLLPDARVWLSRAPEGTRKLAYTWEMVETPAGLAGTNTVWPNRIAGELLALGRFAPLAGYRTTRAEVRYGENSRIDWLAVDRPGDRRPCWIEVKNVTVAQNGTALFPDAVTSRGKKHLTELAARVRSGDRAGVLFVVQRPDAEAVAPADEIDPAWGAAFREALGAGVEAWAVQVALSPETGMTVTRELPVRPGPTGPGTALPTTLKALWGKPAAARRAAAPAEDRGASADHQGGPVRHTSRSSPKAKPDDGGVRPRTTKRKA